MVEQHAKFVYAFWTDYAWYLYSFWHKICLAQVNVLIFSHGLHSRCETKLLFSWYNCGCCSVYPIQTAPFSHLEICPRVFTGSHVEEKVTHPLHSSQTSFEVLAPAYEWEKKVPCFFSRDRHMDIGTACPDIQKLSSIISETLGVLVCVCQRSFETPSQKM